MLYQTNKIDKLAFVKDIVKQDYRAATVFRRYGIDFCCGASSTLEMACLIRNLDLETIQKELAKATRSVYISNTLQYEEWEPDFLIDYIVHVHHSYLKIVLPELLATFPTFVESHRKKYSFLPELLSTFADLAKEMLSHISQEEEIIFPYIKQIFYAYKDKEPYGSLLVRTLSKPVADVMKHEHDFVVKALERMRILSNDYVLPPDACTNYRANILTLQEIDDDITQHLHLENNILFPKAIEMEGKLRGKI